MRSLAILALLTFAAPAHAAVVESTPTGFETKNSVEIRAPAKKVFNAMVNIRRWWSPEHTYSGKAGNLSIDPVAGGCWCETWRGNDVSHMRVVYAEWGKELKFFGGLGPLQNTGAAGHLDWKLTEKDGVTTVTWTYDVGGYVKGGIGSFAAPVDGVLKDQLGRLKAYVEAAK
jgi:uncharacterized protein YndB with AHSA1/START domain